MYGTRDIMFHITSLSTPPCGRILFHLVISGTERYSLNKCSVSKASTYSMPGSVGARDSPSPRSSQNSALLEAPGSHGQVSAQGSEGPPLLSTPVFSQARVCWLITDHPCRGTGGCVHTGRGLGKCTWAVSFPEDCSI